MKQNGCYQECRRCFFPHEKLSTPPPSVRVITGVCAGCVRGRTRSGVTCPSTSPISPIHSTRKITRYLSQRSYLSPTHRVSSQSHIALLVILGVGDAAVPVWIWWIEFISRLSKVTGKCSSCLLCLKVLFYKWSLSCHDLRICSCPDRLVTWPPSALAQIGQWHDLHLLLPR